ncbi:hypothetical protein PROFUN_14713 [Planoprotostelium fungivorum]|uniref:Peptidase S53 domain-containing protein n=1 Tax=Planoprotostelium fungivorum TaxID=1890364 RepID=A0A2P6MZ51_9EUKA|nr:hypothetical protein PROFUN_14713 [Planoprotostelium fungivorum]
MRVTPALLFSVLFLAVSAVQFGNVNAKPRVSIASRYELPHGWVHTEDPSHQDSVEFIILLKQQNLEALSETFDSVSDPQHANYGKFLTFEELNRMTAPSEAAFSAVSEWLSNFEVETTRGADHIKVSTNVQTVQRMFSTQMKNHFHMDTKRTVMRAHGDVSVPHSISSHVDFIAGLTELFTGSSQAKSYGRAPRQEQEIIITPELLRAYYKVPNNLVGKNPNNLQGIAAFNDFFSEGALQEFMQKYNVPAVNISVDGESCLPNCDEGESDLDMQYMLAMARNVDLFFVQQGANYWILQFVTEVTQRLPRLPLVFSISYGFSELAQCSVATVNCGKLGYTAEQYVTRTNVGLQKLGAAGVSVLVADGDDGAASLGAATGNCPIDPKRYCPVGGCAHKTSLCPAVTIANSQGQQCFFPSGIGSLACQAVISGAGNAVQDAMEAFAQQNQECQWNLDQDVAQQPHVYSACECSQLREVESEGLTISPYTYDPKNGALFVADYPASSPYVTSVGATQFIASADGTSIAGEVVASIKTGSHITTGGGFSSFQPQPKYQAQAVAQWLKQAKKDGTLPPSYSFDKKFRAYPDIAFNGHNYAVFLSKSQSAECPCIETPVDGTSASSPAVAGLFTLINDQLLNAGKPQLGFLNPLLYQMAAESPKAFNDITQGDTKCNRGYCCKYGYSAAKGYDPTTGLGTPNFVEMLNYIKLKKGITSR